MSLHLKRSPLYHRLNGNELGSEAIVTYGKRVSFQSPNLNIMMMEHILLVHLWLFSLRFNWETMEDTPSE